MLHDANVKPTETMNGMLKNIRDPERALKTETTWENCLLRDWSPMLIHGTKNVIAFNNAKQKLNAKSVDDIEVATILEMIKKNLSGMPDAISTYILKYANQNGFANIGESALALYFGLTITTNNLYLPRRMYFILNNDDSVTFKEYFQIKIIGYFSQDGSYIEYSSNSDISMIGVTSSTIRCNDQNQIEHTLDSFKIHLLDGNLLQNNDMQLFGDNFDPNIQIIPSNDKTIENINTDIEDEVTTLIDPKQNFQTAYQYLLRVTQPDDSDSEMQKELKIAGRETLYYARLAKNEKMVPPGELQQLTKFVKRTAKLIEDPSENNLNKHRKNIEDSISGKYHRWGKLIGGAMLVVFGLVVLAAAITLLVTSAGISTPISGLIAGIAGSIMLKGIAIGSGVALAGGGITFAAWGGSMFGAGVKENIATPGEKVLKLAQQERKRNI